MFADLLFGQMLQALDYIATHKYIHRHVKPANILFAKSETEEFTFYLGDFGVSKPVDTRANQVETPMFAAPKVHWQGSKQTTKVDVWSLFVPMLWVLDVDRFRSKAHKLERENFLAWISKLAASPSMAPIPEMVRIGPEERASAAQMLFHLYIR
ncbi:hypothetical protein E4U42_002331 [Claviceps africana]|uniref:non-specific serine/threonine protein kinase n=1 Tax=Claviceps africana TaxID=83212 RepID=A0A8K0J8G6_9HYPO|nr:hypothetical protein E4U42_002331 [Claviceps africana]